MEVDYSDLPDLSGLSELEREIFDFVLEHWPTNTIEIAENLKEDLTTREKKRRMSAKYTYYLKKLVEKRLVMCKKAGNSIIVWPLVVEKYRVIHDILKGQKYEYSTFFNDYLGKKYGEQKKSHKSLEVNKNA